jgi:excisionase family DNA binding protein
MRSHGRTIMTMPAFAKELGDRLPSSSERDAANQLRRVLAAQGAESEHKFKVVDETGAQAEVLLSPGLSRLLMEVLRHIGRGDAVTLVPVSQMLTTQQAADILNVSRPFLISLLEKGEIPYHTVGRHRRIRAEDLFTYRQQRDEERAHALSRLAEMDADLI